MYRRRWTKRPELTIHKQFEKHALHARMCSRIRPDGDVGERKDTLTSTAAFETPARQRRPRTPSPRASAAGTELFEPWTQETNHVHPDLEHPAASKRCIDQLREVGRRNIILKFRSGMNLESTDPNYQKV